MCMKTIRAFGLMLLALSTLGNSIDFFRDTEEIKSDMRAPVDFILDDSDRFIDRLESAQNVMFLADSLNGFQIFFSVENIAMVGVADNIVDVGVIPYQISKVFPHKKRYTAVRVQRADILD